MWQYRCWWLEGTNVVNGPWIDLTPDKSGIRLMNYVNVELRMVNE